MTDATPDPRLVGFLRTPAAEHALTRPNRGVHRVLVCAAPGCGYTTDRGTRPPAASERQHTAYVAALQLAFLTNPPEQVLSTAEELDALPAGTVVLPFDSSPRAKAPTGAWHAVADPVGRPSAPLAARGFVVVLHTATTSDQHANPDTQHGAR